MDPLTISALVAGGGAALQAGGGLFSSAMNVHESRQNRRFQRDMSNTAHQRAVADLKKAGLNPILSATKGGASTPSGSGTQLHNPMEGMAQAGSAHATLRQQQPLLQAQVAHTNAQTNVANMTAKSIQQDITQKDIMNPLHQQHLTTSIDNLKVNTNLSAKHAEVAEQQLQALKHKMHELEAEGALWKKMNETFTPEGAAIMSKIGSLLTSGVIVGTVAGTLGKFLSSAKNATKGSNSQINFPKPTRNMDDFNSRNNIQIK